MPARGQRCHSPLAAGPVGGLCASASPVGRRQWSWCGRTRHRAGRDVPLAGHGVPVWACSTVCLPLPGLRGCAQARNAVYRPGHVLPISAGKGRAPGGGQTPPPPLSQPTAPNSREMRQDALPVASGVFTQSRTVAAREGSGGRMACVRVLPPPWGPQDAHKEPGYLYPGGRAACSATRASGPQGHGAGATVWLCKRPSRKRSLRPGASPGNTPSPPLRTSGGQRSRRRGLFPWTVVTSLLAWPRDLGTSFGGPHGALGVTAKGHRHPAQRTRGGKTQFSNIAFPASRRPPLDSAHFVSTLATRRNTGARGTASASQGCPAGAARARYYRENSGKVFAGRPYLDLAPLPAQQSPMQLTPGRAAGHPPGHPGARPRLRGSQEIGNC